MNCLPQTGKVCMNTLQEDFKHNAVNRLLQRETTETIFEFVFEHLSCNIVLVDQHILLIYTAAYPQVSFLLWDSCCVWNLCLNPVCLYIHTEMLWSSLLMEIFCWLCGPLRVCSAFLSTNVQPTCWAYPFAVCEKQLMCALPCSWCHSAVHLNIYFKHIEHAF